MKLNSEFFGKMAYMFIGGAIVTGLHAIFGMAFAQTPAAQSIGEVYVSLALSIISLANTVYAQYLAQKAKATGQEPNETDLKIARALVRLEEKANAAAGGIANLTDFLGNTVAPELYNKIGEGTLPYIKSKEVTAQVGKAEADFTHAVDLLNTVESQVQGTTTTVIAKPIIVSPTTTSSTDKDAIS